MNEVRVWGAALLVGLTVSGCSGVTGPKIKVPQPAPVPEARAERLEPGPAAEVARLADQLSRVAGELNEVENALAKVIVTSRLHESRLQAFDRRLAEIAARNRDGASPAPPGFAPSAVEPTPSPGSSSATTPAEDLYREGMVKFRAGQPDAAVLNFYELIADYPSHPLRESAQFQVADIFYAQSDLRGALAEFESLVVALPNGSKTSDALLKIGLCQRGLGDETKARKVWQRVIKEYPSSAAARQARILLRTSRES